MTKEEILFMWLFLVPAVASAMYVFMDAIKRNKSAGFAVLAAALVLLLFWPLSLIAWFVLRPARPSRSSVAHP